VLGVERAENMTINAELKERKNSHGKNRKMTLAHLIAAMWFVVGP
jgi:hypothetical protein